MIREFRNTFFSREGRASVPMSKSLALLFQKGSIVCQQNVQSSLGLPTVFASSYGIIVR